MDDAIVKLRDIYNENYHYKVCTIGMTSNRVRSVLKTERSDRVWLKDLDISYLEDTLRKKVERLTTKNRSLEVLSDDLKSENKTLKSNLIKQEVQINSVVNVMKTKNNLLEAKDAMIETLKSQIKNLDTFSG